jgi:hypothetical protein
MHSALQAFRRLLSGQRTDTPIWTADLSYWMTGQACAGRADPAWEEEEGYLAFHRDLGVMPYYYYPKFWTAQPVDAPAVECRVEQDGRTTRRRMLTPQPVGDVALEEMRALAGSAQVILWGGLPGAMFAPPFTWAEMEAHLHRLLTAWAGTPFVIGVADQVPPDGDIAFCARIAELLAGQLS